MAPICLVPGCTDKNRKGRTVSLHRFPCRDSERCKQWLRAIKHPKFGEDTPKEKLKHPRVCSLHFKEEDYENNVLGMKKEALKDTAVPSIFVFEPDSDDEQSAGLSKPGSSQPPDPTTSVRSASCTFKRSRATQTEPSSEAGEQKPEFQLVYVPGRDSSQREERNPDDHLPAHVTMCADSQQQDHNTLQLADSFTEPIETRRCNAEEDAETETLPATNLQRHADEGGIFTLLDEPLSNRVVKELPAGLYRSSDIQEALSGASTSTKERAARQHIVDEEALLQLMKSCPKCNRACRCHRHSRGPYLLVSQSCYYCPHRTKWSSQPEALSLCARTPRAPSSRKPARRRKENRGSLPSGQQDGRRRVLILKLTPINWDPKPE